jgi:energy-converting hydrogenase A subunit M
VDFLEEMAEMTNLDKDTLYGLKIDVEEVYEILNRVLDVRLEEGWLV